MINIGIVFEKAPNMKWGFFIILIFLSSCMEPDPSKNNFKQPIRDIKVEYTSTSSADQKDSTLESIPPKQKVATVKKIRLTSEPGIQMVDEQIRTQHNEPKTLIQSHFSLQGTSIHFEKNYTYSNPSIGCGNSSYTMRFSVPVTDSHFVISGQDLQSINFEYNHTGGLLFYHSTEVLDGYIEGRKLSNGNWDVLVKVFFTAEETPSLGESGEHKVQMQDEYSAL